MIVIIGMILTSMAVITISGQVINQIKQNKNSKDNIESKYLAEAGIENLLSEVNFVENTSTENEDTNEYGYKDLIYNYIVQSKLLVEQAKYEHNDQSKDDEYKKIIDILETTLIEYNNFNPWDTEIKKKIEEIKNSINGFINSSHATPQIAKDYLEDSVDYLNKASHVLDSERYKNKPQIDAQLVKDLYGYDNEKNDPIKKYNISMMNIRNYSLDTKLRGNGTSSSKVAKLNKLREYLNAEGGNFVSIQIQQTKIANEIQQGIIVNQLQNQFQSVYWPKLNISEISTLIGNATNEGSLFKLIEELRDLRDGEVSQLNKNMNKYIKENTEKNNLCALNLVKLSKQDINIVISEIQYIRYLLGSEDKIELPGVPTPPASSINNTTELYINIRNLNSTLDGYKINTIKINNVEQNLNQDKINIPVTKIGNEYVSNNSVVIESEGSSNGKVYKLNTEVDFKVDTNKLINYTINSWNKS